MDLAEEVYALTRRFPAAENYGMTSQVRRSVVSVAANVAEGHARSTAKDFANFLSIARGSLAETETYLLLAMRLGYLSDADAQPALSLVDEVGRMLVVLRRRIAPR
jgi:four helix bundle protein